MSEHAARPVFLWGAKSQARIAEHMLREAGLGAATLMFDPTLQAPAFATSAHFSQDVRALPGLLAGIGHFVVCIGGEHGYARVVTAQRLESLGLAAIPLVHAQAFVDPSATVGRGLQAMPGAIIHKFCTLGDQVLINTGATVDHETTIGNGVHIMGSAAVAGRVRIGDYATIGTNATILPSLDIGEGAYIGAGAVVVRDVAPYEVVVGVPARRLRTRENLVDTDLLAALAAR